MRAKIEPDRARAIGKALFQKYDLGNRGVLGPKQCYQVFSDYVYRILSIRPEPTMEQADSMFKILDLDRDKNVTEADFQNLAIKYLCNGNMSSSMPPPPQSTTQYSQYSTSTRITTQVGGLRSSGASSSRYVQSTTTSKTLSSTAKRQLDVAVRLFKQFDKDSSGYLTQQQIPLIIKQTYRMMGVTYTPSEEDIKSYMKMYDKNGDGRISLQEFEEITLKCLAASGIQLYQ